MREHGMLFNAPMVRALLWEDSPKTVTRRLITPYSALFGSAPKEFWKHANFEQAWEDGKGCLEEYLHVPCHRGDAKELTRLDKVWSDKGQPNGYREQYPDCGPCIACDYWGWRMTCHRLWSRVKPGDRIWVKEAWRPRGRSTNDGWTAIEYRSDLAVGKRYWRDLPTQGQLKAKALDISGARWRPSIHLPMWASRLTLDVLSVRAERLQDITEEDARAEGVDMAQFWTDVPGRAAPLMSPSNYRAGFAVLWDQINGVRAPWKSNPYVWIYELRRVERADA